MFTIHTLECVVFRAKLICLIYKDGHIFYKNLFDDCDDIKDFKKKIQQYSNALAFASVSTNIDKTGIQGSGPASFCIHGAPHHLMKALILPDKLEPFYAQLYIYDSEEATNRYTQHNPQLYGATLLDLHTTLRETHPYASLYKQA